MAGGAAGTESTGGIVSQVAGGSGDGDGVIREGRDFHRSVSLFLFPSSSSSAFVTFLFSAVAVLIHDSHDSPG